VNPNTTAIVLVDVDNEFLSEQGKLHGAVKEVLDDRRVIDNINELTRRARERGVQVFLVPLLFSSDYREMGEDPGGIFRVVKEAGALKRGTWGAEVADTLEVRDDDIVIADKTATCAFETTDLDEQLRSRGITDIAVGGLLTNVCVESTMRTAYDKGYTVHSLTDCSATLSLESQDAAIAHNWPMFSNPLTHNDFIDGLGV